MAKLKLNLKKIDLTGVKKFLLDKGEKLGLGVVLGIGLLMVGWSLWGAMNVDGKTLTQNMRRNTEKIKRDMMVDPAGPLPPIHLRTDWLNREFTFQSSQWFGITDLAPLKRANPTVVSARVEANSVQFDYLRPAIQVYALERNNEKVEVAFKGGGEKGAAAKLIADKQFQLVESLNPKHMVVVTCSFPMSHQLQEFKQALQLPMSGLKGKDYPQILGVNIVRVDKVLDPKTNEYVVADEIPLYLTGKQVAHPTTGKIMDDKVASSGVAPHLDDLLRDVRIDDEALAPFAVYRVPGLMTLMPKLANASYPPLKLKGFEEVLATAAKNGKDAKEKGFKDKGPMGVDKELPAPKFARELDKVKWADLEPPADGVVEPKLFQPGVVGQDAKWGPLVKRWRGISYPVFDSQDAGSGRDKDGIRPGQDPRFKLPPKGANPGDAPGGAPGGDPGKKAAEPAPLDPLIRFFDVDLEPDHVYEYKIQVRMANPNFNKPLDVTVEADSKLEELPPSEWRTTPAFKVPPISDEIAYYAVDQWMRRPACPCGPDAVFIDDKTQKAPVQIHRWIGKAEWDQDKYLIADWVVAERVLVRRGEYIGRKVLDVPAPTWSKRKDDFEILNPPKLPTEDKDKKVVVPPAPGGIKLDFAVTDALLVDFDGGPRPPKKASGFTTAPKTEIEESAFDLLILKPDGKLMVRNSHRDFNVKARLDVEKAYHDRVERYIVRPTGEQPGKEDPSKKTPIKIFDQ